MEIKKYLPLGMLLAALPMNAQDIYKLETLTGTDLNGTARYVGMGGAMNALGAEISTMAGNPAAIGLYRKSDVALTGSVSTQPNAREFYDINKVRPSFDQIGFVYASRMGNELKFVNFGFNYHKRRNLKNFIGVDHFNTGGLSQSLQMLDLSYYDGWLDLSKDEDRNRTTPLTNLGYDTQMIAPLYDEDGKLTGYAPSPAQYYNYKRAQWGGIHQFDFNLSANWNDRIYAGFTLGIQSVNIHTGTYYNEMLTEEGTNNLHPYYLSNEEELTGNGIDVKLGMIFRPIETSPFRIGIAVHTPTFYSLTNDAYLTLQSPYKHGESSTTNASVDVVGNEYNIRTPWKFNISMATTVANVLALDAEYEYCDYTFARVKYDNYNDYYYSGSGKTDYALKEEAKRYMKPVSTFKVGAEARLTDNIYFRAGYNYVSAPMKKNAFLNLFTNSSSYFYSTNTDYVNLGEIQRATFGLGFKTKNFYADFAYQFQKQQGDLYTFHVPAENVTDVNRLDAAVVDLDRHNFMLTVGYKF